MPHTQKRKARKPRVTITAINPTTKAHGRKGYNRRAEKKIVRDLTHGA